MSGGQGVGSAGGAGVPQAAASYSAPKLGEVCHVSNQAHLAKIIRDSPGVVVDFWSPTCPPCMRFKPVFEGAARANQNKNIVFCAVECDRARDCAQANNVRSIPQFNFFLNGASLATFVGADEIKFRKHLGDLHEATMSKASQHMSMQFREFKPMNRLPVGFTGTANLDKMKEFISKLAVSSAGEVKVDAFRAWLDTFDIKRIGAQALDQLVALSEIAEDKQKIALVDLLRLLVLEEEAAHYLFERHWELVDVCVIGYVSCQDLSDREAKVAHNYHLACLKFLANAFQTEAGRRAVMDPAKAVSLTQFCATSLASANPKTVLHAALLLFNQMLCWSREHKRELTGELQAAFKAIDTCLSNKELVDPETLTALVLCECRILYQNLDMCQWLEDQFRLYFTETHADVAKRVQD